VTAHQRWVIDRTTSGMHVDTKLGWWTERRTRIGEFWLAVAAVIGSVGRRVREGWRRYRWDRLSRHKP
jgi:hypothetical protein